MGVADLVASSYSELVDVACNQRFGGIVVVQIDGSVERVTTSVRLNLQHLEVVRAVGATLVHLNDVRL